MMGALRYSPTATECAVPICLPAEAEALGANKTRRLKLARVARFTLGSEERGSSSSVALCHRSAQRVASLAAVGGCCSTCELPWRKSDTGASVASSLFSGVSLRSSFCSYRAMYCFHEVVVQLARYYWPAAALLPMPSSYSAIIMLTTDSPVGKLQLSHFKLVNLTWYK